MFKTPLGKKRQDRRRLSWPRSFDGFLRDFLPLSRFAAADFEIG